MASDSALLCCLGILSTAHAAGQASQGLPGLGDVPGVWQMRGYGRVLDISAARVLRYDLTDVSCIRFEDQSLMEAAGGFDRLEPAARELSLFESGGITRYTFDRLPQLPQRCETGDRRITDPVLNFQVFWHAFRENYAFFKLRQVDWDQIYDRFRPGLTEASSETDLFNVLAQILDALDDRHVTLSAGEREIESGGKGELEALWLAQSGARAGEESTRRYRDAVHGYVVDDLLKGQATHGANGAITWGWAARDVGYINVATMRIPAASGQGRMPLPDQLALVDTAMASALRDLRGAGVLIVDGRFNGGGNDAVALRIMGAFTDERRLAFTKQAVRGGGFTEPQAVYYSPTVSGPFTGPIYYLQSGNTVSAAEIFTLALMSRPDVTRIGTPTYGVLSDMLDKQLPNGWSFSLSNEIYLAVDGKCYESLGIPPTHPTDPAKARDFRGRLQLDVDAALELARHAAG